MEAEGLTEVGKSRAEGLIEVGLSTSEDTKRIIGRRDISLLHTWIDAAYAVHDDMRSQATGCLSLVRSVIHTKLSKRKLNTKSSTEVEVVGLSEHVLYILWMKNFLAA